MSETAWGNDVLPQDGKRAHRRSGRRRAPRWALSGVAVVFAVAGCGPPRTPYPEALQSKYPQERVQAIKRVAETRDHARIGIVVDLLEDEDEAVRFYAILALEKLTGTRMGYEYHASEALRGRAVQRWRAYLARPGGGGASSPGGA